MTIYTELAARIRAQSPVALTTVIDGPNVGSKLLVEPDADPRAVDDRDQRGRLLRAKPVAQCLVQRVGHQSSASMNSRIVPPHVRPTANASSSL